MIFTRKTSDSVWFHAPGSSQELTGDRAFSSFRSQNVHDSQNRWRVARLDPSAAPTQITGTIEVIDNDFTTGNADLQIDKFLVRSTLDWTPGGTLNLSAAALALVIDNLPGFSATALGAVVTVLGPTGPHLIQFTVLYRGSKVNFTLTPDSGYMASGEPSLDGPEITAI